MTKTDYLKKLTNQKLNGQPAINAFRGMVDFAVMNNLEPELEQVIDMMNDGNPRLPQMNKYQALLWGAFQSRYSYETGAIA